MRLNRTFGDAKGFEDTYRSDPAAEAWIKRRSGSTEPWAAFVSLVSPHYPLTCPAEDYALYDPDAIPLPEPGDPAAIAQHPWWKAFHESIIFDRYFTDDGHRRRPDDRWVRSDDAHEEQDTRNPDERPPPDRLSPSPRNCEKFDPVPEPFGV